MMALAGIELETLVSEPDALTTRPPPCAHFAIIILAISTASTMRPPTVPAIVQKRHPLDS